MSSSESELESKSVRGRPIPHKMDRLSLLDHNMLLCLLSCLEPTDALHLVLTSKSLALSFIGTVMFV